jgi:pimeloyl-ACP methyl ester carboxylesterase
MRVVVVVAAAMSCLLANGCMFQNLRRQQQRLDRLCLVSGTIAGDASTRDPRIVVLLQLTGDAVQLIDHFVSDGDGRWLMAARPGQYSLAAFEDRSRDLIYQPGEPVLNRSAAPQVHCDAGTRIVDLELSIPADGGTAYARDIDVAKMQARTPAAQFAISFASVTAAGEPASLDDGRFSDENVAAGVWKPYDFLIHAGPGIYLLEPHDANRTPVLFVHGINGSPRNFRYLIHQLDRTRFEPWVYYYPSGVRLGSIADHLQQTLLQMHVRYRLRSLIVVAHSMGGLVSRGFLLKQEDSGSSLAIPLFISLSTPWGGHDAAQKGVKYAPTVVRSWYDMAPRSEYLQSLFQSGRRLPAATRHHLLFSYRKSSNSFGESSDGVVTLASELRAEAQRQAFTIRGFDATHTGILEDPAAVDLINDVLADMQ